MQAVRCKAPREFWIRSAKPGAATVRLDRHQSLDWRRPSLASPARQMASTCCSRCSSSFHATSHDGIYTGATSASSVRCRTQPLHRAPRPAVFHCRIRWQRFLDTGASTHMATYPGIPNCRPISSDSTHIIVGNGALIPCKLRRINRPVSAEHLRSIYTSVVALLVVRQ
jgi:hypothetical protein